MKHISKEFYLKYGIPSLVAVIVLIQVFLMCTEKLNAWKGGGYGMYSEMHYYYNQIYIPGFSIDSLIKDDREMKDVLGFLKLMPNEDNLKKSAQLVLKRTQVDSIHIQIWEPTINSENGKISRVLINEIHLTKSAL